MIAAELVVEDLSDDLSWELDHGVTPECQTQLAKDKGFEDLAHYRRILYRLRKIRLAFELDFKGLGKVAKAFVNIINGSGGPGII